MGNEELKSVYDSMHQKGATSWFSDGAEERETILKMGEPWKGEILEVGCGEGNLSKQIWSKGGIIRGIDYSEEAIKKARMNTDYFEPALLFSCESYRSVNDRYDRLVMQGVLEHLDQPFVELKWMMDNLLVEHGDVITSSPCFLNPRGIVWMTLNFLGAVMSKTDLHYIDPYQLEDFAKDNGYRIELRDCDLSWGNREDMIHDLTQRIPLALKDGNIPFNQERLDSFLKWLSNYRCDNFGANVVYRIIK